MDGPQLNVILFIVNTSALKSGGGPGGTVPKVTSHNKRQILTVIFIDNTYQGTLQSNKHTIRYTVHHSPYNTIDNAFVSIY